MSKSHSLAALVLLLIGLTSISSVAGLKCYWCHANDIGFYNCANSPAGVEQICKPDENACYRETHITDRKKVVSLGCMKAEHMEVGCKDITTVHGYDADEVKVSQCICKTDFCNGGAGGKRVKRHGDHGGGDGGGGADKPAGKNETKDGGGGASGLRPQLLIAVSSLAAVAVLIFLQ